MTDPKEKYDRVLLLVALGFLLFLPDCGRKAPPVPPKAVVPEVAMHLDPGGVGHEPHLTPSVSAQQDST